MIVWNLRSSAASFSMCFLNSSRVVAPMHCISPRDNAGFRMLDASMAPSAPPAPTSVCNSSINMIIFSERFISSMTAFMRSSNCPLYFVPATIIARSSIITLLSRRFSGISPFMIFCARPSTIAVLPTPASPRSTGLFFVLRESIWMTRSISSFRPITGSSFPSRARVVRSLPKASNEGVFVFACACCCVKPGVAEPKSDMTSCLTLFKSSPRLVSTWLATPSPSRMRPRSRCSVPI